MRVKTRKRDLHGVKANQVKLGVEISKRKQLSNEGEKLSPFETKQQRGGLVNAVDHLKDLCLFL